MFNVSTMVHKWPCDRLTIATSGFKSHR